MHVVWWFDQLLSGPATEARCVIGLVDRRGRRYGVPGADGALKGGEAAGTATPGVNRRFVARLMVSLV
jgi:hypothetical protein